MGSFWRRRLMRCLYDVTLYALSLAPSNNLLLYVFMDTHYFRPCCIIFTITTSSLQLQSASSVNYIYDNVALISNSVKYRSALEVIGRMNRT